MSFIRISYYVWVSTTIFSTIATASDCSSIPKTVLLIDRTVDNKDALSKETASVLQSFADEAWTNSEKYFGSELEQVFVDDAGESPASWTMKFPMHLGMQRKDWRAARSALGVHLKETVNEIKNSKIKYGKSFLLEGVYKQIERLGKCDRLVILSDMCVVDNSGNNFEKLVFNKPSRLPVKAQVEIRRIPRNGQSLQAIRLIDAWWKDTLYGDRLFQKEQNKATSFKPLHVQPLGGTRKSSRLKPGLVSAGALLSKKNSWRIAKASEQLSNCTSAHPRREPTDYVVRIFVNEKGTPTKGSWLKGESQKVMDCFWRVISGMTFEKDPQLRPYVYSQKIHIRDEEA